MKYINKEFAKSLLSVPTYTGNEFRLIEFIIEWADQNGIEWEQDDYRNLYLKKGTLKKREYYPCVSAHLDTVFQEQMQDILGNLRLEVLERETERGIETYVPDTGIGASSKAGVLICLELIKRCNPIKACFFVEADIDCLGSKRLDKKWFSNVGYVISWENFGKNNASFSSHETILFEDSLYEIIKDMCRKHGVYNYSCDPILDVSVIRSLIGVQCLNFGYGGYMEPRNEYVILEETDEMIEMGLELIKRLGNNLYLGT